MRIPPGCHGQARKPGRNFRSAQDTNDLEFCMKAKRIGATNLSLPAEPRVLKISRSDHDGWKA